MCKVLVGLSLAMSISAAYAAPAEVDCAHLPQDYTQSDISKPMRFLTPDKQECYGNAVNFPYLAVGEITKDTPAAFAEFAKRHPPDAPIEFVSPGGVLMAGLKLGELIRAGGYDTSLGELCTSACAYAILGGVNRYIAQDDIGADSDYDNRNIGAEGTKLGIHQFYEGAALDEPTKKAFSAIDKSADQMVMAILLEYALRMGVDPRLLQAASTVPPWQDMRWLTHDEMIEWKLDNTHRIYTGLTFHSFGRSGSYVEVGSVKGAAQSYLRMFCKSGVKEPIFTFITDQVISKDVPRPEGPIASAKDYVTQMLSSLNIVLTAGASPWTGQFQVQDVQAFAQNDDIVRVFAAVRPNGFNRQTADKLTRVALEDNGNLGRAQWTFQDFVKFKIQGDRKLIGLAMRNCVE
jgi:hypothetical protein